MKTLFNFFIVLILVGCTYSQSVWHNTTDMTKWEEAPDIKLVTRMTQFRPELDIGGGGRRLPQIQVKIKFKNTSQTQIKSATFEIILFCQNTGTDADSQPIKVKPFIYKDNILPNEEGSFHYEPSVESLTLPIKQIIRVSQIEYADGTIWKLAETN